MPALFAQLFSDALLHFSGAQVPTFLQGQLTCDCLPVNETRSARGALCSAQGRVLADCRVLQLGDKHYALRVRRDVRSIAHETLKKYALFSRTQISEQDDEWTLLGLWGEGATAIVRAIAGDAPDQLDQCVATEALVACRADDVGEAFELFVRHAALPDVLTTLSSQIPEFPEADWQQNELQRGLVRTTADLSGKHVPQVLNYDLAGLLNFRKGCYIGQEVVARLHYKGKSKRRCAIYSTAPESSVESGAVLSPAGTDSTAGSVLRVVRAEARPTLVVALVSVTDGALDLTLNDAGKNNPILQPLTFPYSVRGSNEAS